MATGNFVVRVDGDKVIVEGPLTNALVSDLVRCGVQRLGKVVCTKSGGRGEIVFSTSYVASNLAETLIHALANLTVTSNKQTLADIEQLLAETRAGG